METYLKTLQILKNLLIASDYPFWADWMQQDIDLWNTKQETDHHLHAFGGTGSFNDVNLNDNTALALWKNALLGNLSSISYGFAKNKKIEFPENNFAQLEGSMCKKCKNAEMNSDAIERYLASKYVPPFVAKSLEPDNYLDLIDLKNLVAKPEVSQERSAIIEILKVYAFTLKPDNSVWKSFDCQKCGEPNKYAYRWDIVLEKGAIALLKSNDNLEI